MPSFEEGLDAAVKGTKTKAPQTNSPSFESGLEGATKARRWEEEWPEIKRLVPTAPFPSVGQTSGGQHVSVAHHEGRAIDISPPDVHNYSKYVAKLQAEHPNWKIINEATEGSGGPYRTGANIHIEVPATGFDEGLTKAVGSVGDPTKVNKPPVTAKPPPQPHHDYGVIRPLTGAEKHPIVNKVYGGILKGADWVDSMVGTKSAREAVARAWFNNEPVTAKSVGKQLWGTSGAIMSVATMGTGSTVKAGMSTFGKVVVDYGETLGLNRILPFVFRTGTGVTEKFLGLESGVIGRYATRQAGRFLGTPAKFALKYGVVKPLQFAGGFAKYSFGGILKPITSHLHPGVQAASTKLIDLITGPGGVSSMGLGAAKQLKDFTDEELEKLIASRLTLDHHSQESIKEVNALLDRAMKGGYGILTRTIKSAITKAKNKGVDIPLMKLGQMTEPLKQPMREALKIPELEKILGAPDHVPGLKRIKSQVGSLTARIGLLQKNIQKNGPAIAELKGVLASKKVLLHDIVDNLNKSVGPGQIGQEAQTAHAFWTGMVNRFHDSMSLARSTGENTMEGALRRIADVHNATQGIRASVQKWFESLSKEGKNVYEALENPLTYSKLTPELRNLVKISQAGMDRLALTANSYGRLESFIEDYIHHGFMSDPAFRTAAGARAAGVVATAINATKKRTLHETNEILGRLVKGAREGGLSPGELNELGLGWAKEYRKSKGLVGPAHEMTQEEKALWKETQRFLEGKKLLTDPVHSLAGWTSSFVRSELRDSVTNMLQNGYVNQGFTYLRYAMSPLERDALSRTAFDVARHKGTNEVSKIVLQDVNKVLASYRSLPELGFSPRVLFHPYVADAIKEHLAGAVSNRFGNLGKGLINLNLFTKQIATSYSAYHLGNIMQIAASSGLGLENFAFPQMLKHMESAAGQAEMAWWEKMGANWTYMRQLANKAVSGDGLLGADKEMLHPTMEKLNKWSLTDLTFNKYGLATQMMLNKVHLSRILAQVDKGLLPSMTREEAGRVAAMMTNLKIGTLRPELMNSMVRDVGSAFVFAKNWTGSNFWIVANAMNEWIAKPTGMETASKVLGGMMNKIQNIEGMSEVEQEVLKKEMAEFFGTSLFQHQFYTQLTSLLVAHRLTYFNPPGHEYDIAVPVQMGHHTGQGRYQADEMYFGTAGWLNDFYKSMPVGMHLPDQLRRDGVKAHVSPDDFFYNNAFGAAGHLSAKLATPVEWAFNIHDLGKQVAQGELSPSRGMGEAVSNFEVTPFQFKTPAREHWSGDSIFQKAALGIVLGASNISLTGSSPRTEQARRRQRLKNAGEEFVKGLKGE